MPVLGIDLGATNMQFGVVDDADAITGRARAKSEADVGRDRVVANLVGGVKEACDAAGVSVDDLGAIGIAAAGAIDIPRGVILDAPNLGWKDVPLRDILHRELGPPVVLDNDVNGAVWGEYRLGAGRGRGDVLGVWVGTGIGGGLVLNGCVYRGGFFTAGEIGQTVIIPGERPGQRTVEDLCSRTGMSRSLHRLLPDFPGSRFQHVPVGPTDPFETHAIADAYDANDHLTHCVVDHAADLLGIAIANWVTVLSLRTVILGGGITEALGELYLDRIKASFEANVFPKRARDCDLLMTELAADSGVLGAALLARESVAEANATKRD